MMKKLLIFTLVLGFASLASAGLRLDAPGYSGEELSFSDELIITVSLDAPAQPFEAYNYVVVADTTAATVAGGVATPLAPVVNQVDGPTAGNDDVILPLGEEGMFYIFANVTFTPVPVDTILIDQILFHCEGNGDVLLKLYLVESGVPTTEANLVDSILIRQTPEPATMALLALGGLFLRRRK